MATTTDTTSLVDRVQGPFAAPEDGLKTLQRVAQALNRSASEPPKLKTADGEEIDLSPTLLRVLRLIAKTLAADRAVVLDSLA
jgi:hypothetical protein